MKRTPLKRSRKPMKRTPLKRGSSQMKRTRLKQKPYRRTKAQEEYHNEHPTCKVCGNPAMPTPHHIDPQKLRADTEENMESLCWLHHIGPTSVHVLGIVRFCELFRLTEDPKWKEVYERNAWRKVGDDCGTEKDSAMAGSNPEVARVSERSDGLGPEKRIAEHPEHTGGG